MRRSRCRSRSSGEIEGRLCLYSQLTGVVPGYQSRGLGYQIKLFQRQFARAEGIERDRLGVRPAPGGQRPFQPRPAGCPSRALRRKHVRRADRRLNAGVPTDRLIAEWNVAAAPHAPLSFDSVSKLPRLIELAQAPRHSLVPVGVMPISNVVEPRLLLEIPADITALRTADPDQAETWRALVSEAFRRALEKSYRAVHFVRDQSSVLHRGFYVLERQ